MKKALTVFFGGIAVAVAVTLITAHSSNGEQPGAAKQAARHDAAQKPLKAYAQADGDDAAASVPIIIFAPLYGSSPRIIHVAQPDDRAEADDAGDAAATADDAGNDIAPAPRIRRITPATREDSRLPAQKQK